MKAVIVSVFNRDAICSLNKKVNSDERTCISVSDRDDRGWYLFPLNYTIANVFDHQIAFTLLGLFFEDFIFNPKENYA